MRAKCEELAHELEVVRQNSIKQVELARLSADTDKLSLKSALEAKMDILM